MKKILKYILITLGTLSALNALAWVIVFLIQIQSGICSKVFTGTEKWFFVSNGEGASISLGVGFAWTVVTCFFTLIVQTEFKDDSK